MMAVDWKAKLSAAGNGAGWTQIKAIALTIQSWRRLSMADEHHLTLREQNIMSGALRDSLKIIPDRPATDGQSADEARRKAFLEAAEALEMSPSTIRLHAGEMTAQEMRTVQAVLRWKAAVFRSIAESPKDSGSAIRQAESRPTVSGKAHD
jgi:hypothetical protein